VSQTQSGSLHFLRLTLTLAGTPYTIQGLTLEQLENLHGEIAPAFTGESRELWQRYRRILAIALSADHPEVTEESLNAMRLGTIQATRTAVNSVLEFGGFTQKAEN